MDLTLEVQTSAAYLNAVISSYHISSRGCSMSVPYYMSWDYCSCGGGGHRGGYEVDRSSFAPISEAAQKRLDDAKQSSDAFLAEAGDGGKAMTDLLSPKVHLTDFAWTHFRKHVIKNGCNTRRREATEEECKGAPKRQGACVAARSPDLSFKSSFKSGSANILRFSHFLTCLLFAGLFAAKRYVVSVEVPSKAVREAKMEKHAAPKPAPTASATEPAEKRQKKAK